MKKIGRNEPCPCGSGKKYKVCCLASAYDSDFQFRWFRRVHDELIPKLIRFAEDGDPRLILDAWMDFNVDEIAEELDPDGPLNELFMPWFLFNWAIEVERAGETDSYEITIAEIFLLANEKKLSADEKVLLNASIRCPYTLCEVVQVKPGVGMTLLDLLRRIQYEVTERTASQSLKRGEIIYCATSEIRGFRSNVGTGPIALQPWAKRDVLELRKWIGDEVSSDRITAEHLHEFEYDIRGFYLEMRKARMTPPTLANTDGDLMLPQRLYFDIASADEAFHALKDLAVGEDEKDLLKEAVFENGSMVGAKLVWLGGSDEVRKRLGGPVLLGSLTIERKRLIIEVNSQKRADLIRRLVESRLGDRATYKSTLIEPIESQVREMWQTASASRGSSAKDRSPFPGASPFISLDEAPELRAALEQNARQYWESWLDVPLPALDNMTPHEAARTEEGRELLESLLLTFESHAGEGDENLFEPDTVALRAKLGMA